jgi:hypothetical protein
VRNREKCDTEGN